MDDLSARQQTLLAALQQPSAWPFEVDRIERIQTHISVVLLAGEYAYKIKKAVDLGFLDFRSLSARGHYCREEIRLNRRTAPELYLAAVPIVGSIEAPVVEGRGEAIEWAVKMRRFSQQALLDDIAGRGELDASIVDRLARRVARFHEQAAIAPAGSAFGSAELVVAPALANFEQIASLSPQVGDLPALHALRDFTRDTGRRLAAQFELRRSSERVRECHGDLHLGNIVLLEGEPVPFDGIEFNDEFRWIDVASDIAFVMMDLVDRGLEPLAWRFANGWLEQSGDYSSMSVMRYYLVYRAMVRAKVDLIRVHQKGLDDRAARRIDCEYHEYLSLAGRLAGERRPALVLMHGLSGSGKTSVSQVLLERLGAVRIRSDVERKRLHGLTPTDRSTPAAAAALYSAQASRRTYDRLAELAQIVLAAGYPLILDAAFLDRSGRERFRTLARSAEAPFAIAECKAPLEVLRERIRSREAAGGDASDATLAVLESQRAHGEPLAEDERSHTVTFASDKGSEALAGASAALAALLGRPQAAGDPSG